MFYMIFQLHFIIWKNILFQRMARYFLRLGERLRRFRKDRATKGCAQFFRKLCRFKPHTDSKKARWKQRVFMVEVRGFAQQCSGQTCLRKRSVQPVRDRALQSNACVFFGKHTGSTPRRKEEPQLNIGVQLGLYFGGSAGI